MYIVVFIPVWFPHVKYCIRHQRVLLSNMSNILQAFSGGIKHCSGGIKHCSGGIKYLCKLVKKASNTGWGAFASRGRRNQTQRGQTLVDVTQVQLHVKCVWLLAHISTAPEVGAFSGFSLQGGFSTKWSSSYPWQKWYDTGLSLYSSYSGNGMTLVQTCMGPKQTFENRKSKSCFGGSAAVTSGFCKHLTLRPKHSRKRVESGRFVAYVMLKWMIWWNPAWFSDFTLWTRKTPYHSFLPVFLLAPLNFLQSPILRLGKSHNLFTSPLDCVTLSTPPLLCLYPPSQRIFKQKVKAL